MPLPAPASPALDVDLSGRVIMVTGATGGLGRPLAIACAARGATVVLHGRVVRKLEAIYDEIENNRNPYVFNWALKKFLASEAIDMERLHLCEADDSLVIDNIEYAMHGHLGANGARGGPRAFKQMGKRSSTAHSHTAGITDGNHTVGVLGKLDMGYNRGLSSWSQTNGVTYENGKRALITLVGSRWRGKEI